MHYASARVFPWRVVGYTYNNVTLAAQFSRKLFHVGNIQNPVSLHSIPVPLEEIVAQVDYTHTGVTV